MDIIIHKDNKILAEALGYFLTGRKHQVYVCETRKDFQEKLRDQNPEIVILSCFTYLEAFEKSDQLSIIDSKRYKISVILIDQGENFNSIKHNIQSIHNADLITFEDGLSACEKCIARIVETKRFTPSCNEELKLQVALTMTEIKIISLLKKGYNTAKISKLLSRSSETIKNHRKNIKQKLGLRGGKRSFLEYLKSYYSHI